jgi:inorganic triphosphatase YgiF
MARGLTPVVAGGHPGGIDPTAATTAMPAYGDWTKTELKLAIRPDDVTRLLQDPILAGALATPQIVVSVYFDTPARKLQKAGLTLRVRRIGNRHIQTIKTDSSDADNRLRFGGIEWEHDIDRGDPDPSLFVGTPLEGMISAGEIVPLFETRIERGVFRIGNAGCDVEVSIDQGEITAGDRRRPLSEIEIESKSGDIRSIFDVALSLCRTLPLFLVMESESQRGYALADGVETLPGKGKARTIQFSAGLPVKSVLQIVGLECMRHLSANIPALLDASDEFALHQMRVAIRRFRAAMSLFKDILQDSESRDVKVELKKMADLFAEARNLEVFAAELSRLIADNPHEPGLRALGALLNARKEEAYRLARYAVLSTSFPCALIRIAKWLAVGTWTKEDPLQRGRAEQPIADLATAEMTRRRKLIKGVVRDFDGLDAAALHRLRIQVKKLRYASEFFDRLFRHRKRKKAFLSSLVDLQTVLGELNDLDVQRNLVLALARLSDPPGTHGDNTGFAAGFIRGRQVSRAELLRKSLETACARILSVRPFWQEHRSS